MKKGCG